MMSHFKMSKINISTHALTEGDWTEQARED